MRLSTIRVRDFKRFADLTVSAIPATAKLVLLTGPNGSGKSSLFEAFNYWMGFVRGQNSFEIEYHSRISAAGANDAGALLNKIELRFHDIEGELRGDASRNRKAFYIRSAYRHEPDFTTNGFGTADDMLADSKRAHRLINQEQRVSENYQRMVAEAVMALYSDDPAAQQKLVRDLADELVGEVRVAMGNVFGDLVLQGPGNPMTGGTFRFKKGVSSNFHYKNLSGGEKAAFDILLDFIVKRRAFNDTVFCIDEPELHMHTRLQAKLLEQMFDLVPEGCQLWLSTHSVGMARKAAELYAANPGQVAFIDFHHQDFDAPTVLSPMKPDRAFWQDMFKTALDDLAELVVPRYVVFCEGKRLGTGGRNPSFDVDVYKIIFSPHFPEIEFIPLGGTSEVQNDGKTFGLLLNRLAPGIRTWKIFDRDDRHEYEVTALHADGVQVLSKRDLESFLWDDEVLASLCALHGKPECLQGLQAEKAALLSAGQQRGLPADDIKAAAGQLYNKCKELLGLTQCGNNAEAFARLTLAPLVLPGTAIYEELRQTVLGPMRQ